MSRSWFDKFFRGEDEEYDDVDNSPRADDPPPPREYIAPQQTPVAETAPTPPMDSSAVAPPVEQPASALRPLRSWAGAEVVSLLNELSPAARERAAEALQLWHDADTQLRGCAQNSKVISDSVASMSSGPLSSPEFASDIADLAQSCQSQDAALGGLLLTNRARAHEWVLAAVQGQRQWGPEQVIRLFDLAGIGQLTLADLLGRLRSMDSGPRAWAAEALGALADPDAIPALLNLLRDPDSTVRVAAVASLGRKADPSTLHPLGQVVKKDPDWLVRLKAIGAAQGFTGYEAIGFLNELLRDSGWWRELQVLDNVGHSDPTRPTPPKEMPVGTFDRVRRGVMETLLARIQTELPSADPAHRAWLMDVLGETGDTRALPLLTSALQDVEQEVRLKAIHGLGHIGGPDVVPLVLPALKDQQSQVRIQAAEALGDCNDFTAIPFLLEAVRDSNPFVRAAVTVAVGKIWDTSGLKPLIAGLNDPDKETRDQTQAAIQRMSDPRTMNVLNGMFEAGGLKKPPRLS